MDIELEIRFKDEFGFDKAAYRELTIVDLNRILTDRSPFKLLLSDYINPILDEYDLDIGEYDWSIVERGGDGGKKERKEC